MSNIRNAWSDSLTPFRGPFSQKLRSPFASSGDIAFCNEFRSVCLSGSFYRSKQLTWRQRVEFTWKKLRLVSIFSMFSWLLESDWRHELKSIPNVSFKLTHPDWYVHLKSISCRCAWNFVSTKLARYHSSSALCYVKCLLDRSCNFINIILST